MLLYLRVGSTSVDSLSRAGQLSAPLCSPPYLGCQVVARGKVLEAVQAVPVPGAPSARVVVDHLEGAEEHSAVIPVLVLAPSKATSDKIPILSQRRPQAKKLGALSHRGAEGHPSPPGQPEL